MLWLTDFHAVGSTKDGLESISQFKCPPQQQNVYGMPTLYGRLEGEFQKG